MSTVSWRADLVVAGGAALAAASLALAVGASSAGAQPPQGDNGTVKIHNSTTPVTDPRNEPHVCVFYLDAFGFDPAQAVSWQIRSWPPTGNRSVVDQGTLTLDSSGNGHTSDQMLPNGHYKLFWTFTGEHGAAKQKVFWVSCPAPAPTPTPPPTSPPPSPSVTPTPPPTSPPPSPSLTPTPIPTSPPPSPSLTAVPPSAAPSPSPSASSSVAPAPAPTPVPASLPVTG